LLKIEYNWLFIFYNQSISFSNFVLRISFVQVLHKSGYQLPEVFQLQSVFINITTGASRHIIIYTFPLWVAAFTLFIFFSPDWFQMIDVPSLHEFATAVRTSALVLVKNLLSFFFRHFADVNEINIELTAAILFRWGKITWKIQFMQCFYQQKRPAV
jgi:hypothetical protein